jgi:hypothetical protein
MDWLYYFPLEEKHHCWVPKQHLKERKKLFAATAGHRKNIMVGQGAPVAGNQHPMPEWRSFSGI